MLAGNMKSSINQEFNTFIWQTDAYQLISEANCKILVAVVKCLTEFLHYGSNEGKKLLNLWAKIASQQTFHRFQFYKVQ